MEKTEEKECVTSQPGTVSKYSVKFGPSGERRTPIVRWRLVMGYGDVGDGCWRPNVLVTSLRFW